MVTNLHWVLPDSARSKKTHTLSPPMRQQQTLQILRFESHYSIKEAHPRFKSSAQRYSTVYSLQRTCSPNKVFFWSKMNKIHDSRYMKPSWLICLSSHSVRSHQALVAPIQAPSSTHLKKVQENFPEPPDTPRNNSIPECIPQQYTIAFIYHRNPLQIYLTRLQCKSCQVATSKLTNKFSFSQHKQ